MDGTEQRGEAAGKPERIADCYIITMLAIFPLFPGFSGYLDITRAKFAFFACVTVLWLGGTAIAVIRSRITLPRIPAAGIAALLYAAICILSFVLSPYRGAGFLGAGRYDGLATQLLFSFAFFGLSLFAKPKRLYAHTLAFSVFLCSILSILQLFGKNPLGFYPNDLTYYDAGTFYTGCFLGTIGSTNELDTLYCLALPLLTGLFVTGERRAEGALLLPVAAAAFVLFRAGGDGAFLALGLTALAALPLLITDGTRLRRLLFAAAAILLPAALASGLTVNYAGRLLSCAFCLSRTALLLLCCSAAALLCGLLPIKKEPRFPAAVYRRSFGILSAAAAAAVLAVTFFFPPENGTMWEFSRVLHGELKDSFGSSRIGIWRACLALVPERPLLGGGPGTLPLRLDYEFSRYVPELGRELTTTVDNAHNAYLGVLVNTGVLGLIAFLPAVLNGSLSALSRNRLTSIFGLAAFCGAVHSFFAPDLCIAAPVLWVLLGLSAGAGRKGIVDEIR